MRCCCSLCQDSSKIENRPAKSSRPTLSSRWLEQGGREEGCRSREGEGGPEGGGWGGGSEEQD